MKKFLIWAAMNLVVLTVSCSKKSAVTGGVVHDLEVGDRVDSLNSVYVYYNGSIAHVEGRNLAPDGYNLGLKYQCVEFVKRYYYEHYRHKMPDSYGHAKSFFDPGVKDGALNKKRDLLQFTNPSAQKPAEGDLVVMDATTFNEYGHVCIVAKVEHNKVEIIQQNPGPLVSSRDVYSLKKTDGKYFMGSTQVLGWLRKR